jgi:hypothetical protein
VSDVISKLFFSGIALRVENVGKRTVIDIDTKIVLDESRNLAERDWEERFLPDGNFRLFPLEQYGSSNKILDNFGKILVSGKSLDTLGIEHKIG